MERNLGSVVNIIRRCVENASSFEAAAQQLKDGRLKMVCLSWWKNILKLVQILIIIFMLLFGMNYLKVLLKSIFYLIYK